MKLDKRRQEALDLKTRKRVFFRIQADPLWKKMNGIERRWAAELEANPRVLEWHYQAITLLLAEGLRYTPDFFCLERVEAGPDLELSEPVFYECKGFWRDDARAKVKMATTVHAWACFRAVSERTKKSGGGWDVEDFTPRPTRTATPGAAPFRLE